MSSPPPWRYLFTECFDPRRTLRGDDLRLYVRRGDAPSRRILTSLQEDPGAPKFFLSGSPGSGKSTELAELGRLLVDTHAVVPVDVYASAANVTDVSGTEILFMMGAAACKVAVDLGTPISEARQQSLVEAFRGVARDPTRVDAERLFRGTATFGVAVGAGLAGADEAGTVVAPAVDAAISLAKRAATAVADRVAPRPFGGLTRELRESDPEVDRLALALAGVLEELGAVRRPVVLIDGLDRVEDPRSIRSLFLQNRLLDLPTCAVVYNGPIFLWLDPDIFALGGRFERCPLPNVTVELPVDGSATVTDPELQQQRAVLKRLVDRRLEAVGLAPRTVLPAEVLDAMVTASGGVLRDLVHLMHRACRLAGRKDTPPDHLTQDLVNQAWQELASEVQPAVANRRLIDELKEVEDQGRPSGSDDSMRLLLRGAILAYDDHLPWFRVHPFLRPLLTPAARG